MSDELQESIARIKPYADAVVDAASALNQAIQAAAENGLMVQIELLEQPADGAGEGAPLVRARISKRIA